VRLVQAGQHGKLRGPGMSAGENQNTFKLRELLLADATDLQRRFSGRGNVIQCATRKLMQLAEAPVSISAAKLSSVGCKTPSGATGLKDTKKHGP